MSHVANTASREHGVEVPYTRLSADVLRRVAEEFVTRGGTDYGAAEKSLDEKVTDVTRQLERGEAAIVYDAESDTINIVQTAAMNFHKLLRAFGLYFSAAHWTSKASFSLRLDLSVRRCHVGLI